MSARENLQAHAGDIIAVLSELGTAEAAVVALSSEITALEAQVAAQAGDITGLTAELADKVSENAGLTARVAELEAQLAECLAGGGGGFLTFDEARAGDLSQYGLAPILVAYESTFFPSSVTVAQRATTAPDAGFLDATFAEIKANNPGVERIVLDLEAWPLVSNGVVNQTVVGWYVILVNAAKAYFNDVGLYGEVPERYTLYMTGTPEENVTRRENWFTRAGQMQPIWDAVTTVYPSVYFINPVYNNATKRDLWYVDIAEMCEQFAPGKKVIPFMWPRVHGSVDPAAPWIDGDYWHSALVKVHEVFDGYVLWLTSGEPELSTIVPEPLWWTRTKEFQAGLGA